MLLNRFRCQARWLTLFLGVMLALLHGPAELAHSAHHAQAIAASVHSHEASASLAPAGACSLCELVALPGTLPTCEKLLTEPLTLPVLCCRALPTQESLTRAPKRFHSLRAPPAFSC